MVAVAIIATIFLDHFIVDARKVQQWPAIIWLVLVSVVSFHDLQNKFRSKPRIKCKLKLFDKIFSAKLIIDASLISEPGVSVVCDENNMTVSLEKQTFPFFNVSSLHLRYSSCRYSIFLVLNTRAQHWINCGLVSSVGRALVCRAGGRGFVWPKTRVF